MDIKNFSVYRSSKLEDLKVGGKPYNQERYFQRLKMDWSNEFGVIDATKDARMKAFLSTEISTEDLLNRWSNFVLDKKYSISDPALKDILRSYTTIQTYSMFKNKTENWFEFGYEENRSAVIVTGIIPKYFKQRVDTNLNYRWIRIDR